MVVGNDGHKERRERIARRCEATGAATYWDIDDIQFHCRIGRTTAWGLVKLQDFPPPVVLGPKGLVWPRAEILTFMESRRRPEHYGDREGASAGRASSYGGEAMCISRPLKGRPARRPE